MHTTSSKAAVDRHYDLIIIGTGSGNSIPGPGFEDRSIAIIEEATFGGTCLNAGCIPSKMYVTPPTPRCRPPGPHGWASTPRSTP